MENTSPNRRPQRVRPVVLLLVGLTACDLTANLGMPVPGDRDGALLANNDSALPLDAAAPPDDAAAPPDDAAAPPDDAAAPPDDAAAPPPEAPRVVEITPEDGARGVLPELAVRIVLSHPIDTTTATDDVVQLQTEDGAQVPSTVGTDATGGLVTLAPNEGLAENTLHVVQVNQGLVTLDGQAVRPFTSRFTTGTATPAETGTVAFQRVLVDPQTANTTLSVGPDEALYVFNVANNRSELRRYRLDPLSGLPLGGPEVLVQLPDQVLGMAFDPDASAEDETLDLWISHADCNSLAFRNAPDSFSGGISRLTLPASSPGPVEQEVFVTGLPNAMLFCAHQVNGIAFGPDGLLYASVGGVSTLGGTPNWQSEESLLSATILAMDLRDPAFDAGERPVNVRADGENAYDPYAFDAPVWIYATGIRNAYDLLWHSNGHFYTANNQNSLRGQDALTPACGAGAAINATPNEMLYRLIPGTYYGHPNALRGECVLNGGNPTSGLDPFEVDSYPVGVPPEPSFDPALIYDLRPLGGNSANGLAEYTAPGPLAGRMLAAFFTGTQTIQTFAFGADGQVTDTAPLTDRNGVRLRFTGALDVAVHPATGHVYVADFGLQASAAGGGLYVLQPDPR